MHKFKMCIVALLAALVSGSNPSAANVHSISLGTTYTGSCTPNAWEDFELTVSDELSDCNLLFEVIDTGTEYNPEALMVALWPDAVPPDRKAEKRTERAAGKMWVVMMNVEEFTSGITTLGVRCSPHGPVDFKVKVVRVPAVLAPGVRVEGEVCPGQWVYHYVNTSSAAADGRGYYGAGNHLRFSIDKPAGAGAALGVVRHFAAPLKPMPPYLRMPYEGSSAASWGGSIPMCDVEKGKMYMGIRGVASLAGCMRYNITAHRFNGSCAEPSHTPEMNPRAFAHAELPIERFARASCAPFEWYDYYFNATAGMMALNDNIVFEVETLSEAFELGGLRVFLYRGYIPLDRATEISTTVPNGGIYSLAIPSTELLEGAYYLSVQCGPNAQRFRTVAFEVRGRLNGPGDAVHGEICPGNWIYHSIAPTFSALAYVPSTNYSYGHPSSGGLHRRLESSIEWRRRRLAAAPGAVEIAPGTHLKFTFTKHQGSFVFMSLIGDKPPTRKQPPLRTLELNEDQDYGVFCNMQVCGVSCRASDCP